MSDYNNGQYDFQQQTFSLSWLTSLSFNLIRQFISDRQSIQSCHGKCIEQ